jgi:hypothetical protein
MASLQEQILVLSDIFRVGSSVVFCTNGLTYEDIITTVQHIEEDDECLYIVLKNSGKGRIYPRDDYYEGDDGSLEGSEFELDDAEDIKIKYAKYECELDSQLVGTISLFLGTWEPPSPSY